MIHILNILLLPILYLIKIKLIFRIGIVNYFHMKKITFSSFPNGLVPIKRISQGGYTIEKILRVCSIKPTQYTPAKKIDLMINFQDLTYSFFDIGEYIKKHNFPHNTTDIICINLNCNDISKTKIASIHKKVFNYPIDIDPCKFVGKAVEKSDINGLHDGKIIECPINKRDLLKDKVYTKLINNTDKNFCYDFRAYYINGLLPFVLVKKKLLKFRFGGETKAAKNYILKTSDCFSSIEINQINQFFKKFKCDVGEVDILRDKKSKLIYVVDLANTPGTMNSDLGLRQKIKLILEISFSFFNNIVLPIIKKENPLKSSTINIKNDESII